MTPLNRKFRAGLAALGLVWTSATTAPGQEAAPPPPMPAPAPPNAPAFAVLLLSNGRTLQGNVTENAAGDAYELHGKGGSFPVPKKAVKKRYGSMAALYEDKVAHLPDRDPDERMNLALWCLEQHMEAQAREQLQGVLAINPSDGRAKRMVANIDANAQRAAGRDPEVRAASAEFAEPAPARTAMPMPRTRSRAVERPVIFDLPPDVAMKRFTAFAWEVHPILQASCASCHNETYQGEYRLIAGKSRRDWTADVVRANLDATLRHVRRDDPAHSDLVAYAANPHGPSPRPLFHGPNDRRYRQLVAWLDSLRTAEPVAKAGFAPPPAAPRATPLAEGFGADRLPSPPGAPTAPAPDARPSAPGGDGGSDLLRIVPDAGGRPGRSPGRELRPAEPPRLAEGAAPGPARRHGPGPTPDPPRDQGRDGPGGSPSRRQPAELAARDAGPSARRGDPADEPIQEVEQGRPGAAGEAHEESPAGPALKTSGRARLRRAGGITPGSAGSFAPSQRLATQETSALRSPGSPDPHPLLGREPELVAFLDAEGVVELDEVADHAVAAELGRRVRVDGEDRRVASASRALVRQTCSPAEEEPLRAGQAVERRRLGAAQELIVYAL